MSSSTPAPAESCDLCGAQLNEPHQHLLERATRRLECVCDGCAVLFGDPHQKYRRVPRRVVPLPQFRMTDSQWDSLMIPIGIAYLFRSSALDRVMALYPSPAGPVESLLSLDAWDEIARENPDVRTLESDVEGLLVYRVGSVREYYIIPIDECFKLVGIIRLKWKGFSGGMAVWQEIGRFLERLKKNQKRRQAETGS
jgi:hypothetical protein